SVAAAISVSHASGDGLDQEYCSTILAVGSVAAHQCCQCAAGEPSRPGMRRVLIMTKLLSHKNYQLSRILLFQIFPDLKKNNPHQRDSSETSRFRALDQGLRPLIEKESEQLDARSRAFRGYLLAGRPMS